MVEGARPPWWEDVGALIHRHDESQDEVARFGLERSLAAIGVIPIRPAPGVRVNPDLHRVVALASGDRPGREGTVADVVRPGWRNQEAVVRQADVRAWGARRQNASTDCDDATSGTDELTRNDDE